MRAYVGVTDRDWYRRLLATGPHHDEVNFWFPSPKQGFQALSPGQPFVFKTHVERSHPEISNRIVGVGLFSGFARETISEAWRLLGTANGVASLEMLRGSIEHYARRPITRFEDPLIGCVFLQDVTFFAESETLPAPDDFAPNLVRGRKYDLADIGAGHSVVEALLRYELLAGSEYSKAGALSETTHGSPTLTVPRIGQQAFKAVIAETYNHRCAITGDKVRPVLEAAHILPVAAGGIHRIDNGLLLRSDVHTLFDRGYLGVDLRHRLRVSPALREQFGNGDWFYQREGTTIDVPAKRADRPAKEFLEWHNDEVFLSA
ncbi:HNH endonuclease [Gordonia sp. (in: high G+C Gram-positive bacteria)]|jgi:putative restriction endonuclease|uniref:HNH endonuclease n=1 Tax=Gordonia sp. (in: high G+C Gram-positive bacteria) TaxID=84139 RepID=UPI001E1746F1|nr:HNH endonuclease [Gordonia sp. (in: high G+C Gram-positive bacteria)]MCB1295428.1 HNH endonuclease [Gordonia sp. (in: high G+C Gram-positive bacteria)]HMS77175.1 HNH endonuclease [Gordonia sp. (in: high G+C Gram-positive bacteria)]HQV18053.1 HNH endonuclease [Gordonia sp. (in: high G+C Gram-positive bacteria)]